MCFVDQRLQNLSELNREQENANLENIGKKVCYI